MISRSRIEIIIRATVRGNGIVYEELSNKNNLQRLIPKNEEREAAFLSESESRFILRRAPKYFFSRFDLRRIMLFVVFLALSFIEEQITTFTIPTTSSPSSRRLSWPQRRSTKKKEVPGVGGGSISVR